MSAHAPSLDPPISPKGERRRQVIRLRPVLVIACIAAATWFVYDARPADHAAEAAHPVPAKPSPAAVTVFYRRAMERTARLMGKPAPRWKRCPSCKLAFHGPDTVPENSATGHTPGDWQP